jgi:hypothetical protein
MPLDLDDARLRYHYSFSPEDHERLPFYSALMRALESDELALELLAGVALEQRNPMLVLGALHLAALRGHPVLAPVYEAAVRGEIVDAPGAARTVIAALHDDPALVRGELHRFTQTNEPGRSAVLQAVIARIANGRDRTINLIDVGTSAGINLHFDQFPVRSRDDDNPLTLICQDLAGVNRSLALPDVATRVGIDLSPLDLAVDDDRLWLKACLWPEEDRRHGRLDAVIDARSSWPDSTVLAGHAMECLHEALAMGDREHLTIVMNTWVVAYFSKADQAAYFDEMVRLCSSENVAWASIESPWMVDWPSPSGDGQPPRKGGSQILATVPGGSPAAWGWCHPHGHWLWMDDLT